MKCHNVCKRHVAIDTGVKQTEHTIEETMPKMSVKFFGNHFSQDSHKNQYSGPVCNFGFTAPQYSENQYRTNVTVKMRLDKLPLPLNFEHYLWVLVLHIITCCSKKKKKKKKAIPQFDCTTRWCCGGSILNIHGIKPWMLCLLNNLIFFQVLAIALGQIYNQPENCF